MASWHENQYHISISNVNLNEPQAMPPESFQDHSEWAQFYRSNCRLDRPQEAQFGMPDNGCVLAPVPGRQQPPVSGFPLMENAMSSFLQSGTEPGTQAREDGHEEVADRKQKRIIKNRESAARSRARKLAYKNELENKVAYLEQELKRLKEQKEQNAVEKLAVKQDSKRVPIRRVNSGPY